MTEEIDTILTLLQDGQWHPITEIARKTRLNQLKIQLITDFLTKYNLIELSKMQQEAKLTPPTQRLVKKVQET